MTSTNFVPALVVAEHAETVFSSADLFSDAADVAMGLVLESIKLGPKFANF